MRTVTIIEMGQNKE